ncbi:hypothetical protein QR680_000727 [Steinernema hermaphroditum]|uniref:Translation initiation factor eIF2B subunit epsilon n=1 Tax=Steinernema hermaphroditum TaxID=289476 RepID=A0AA39GWE9_9BILA|nr:hypothetical protein QR680_000727 [Steinernema hermaphroditum]
MSIMPSLTAVIIADNFCPQFTRMGGSECWGLKKIGSLTYLECCLLWIARTRVRKVVVVVASEHPEVYDKIKSLLNAFDAFFLGTVVVDRTIGSVGDGVRAADRQGLLMEDFMLIHNPTTICASSLDRQIEEFFELRKENKNNTMMLLYRKSHQNSNVPLAIESETGKLLAIDEEEGDGDSAYDSEGDETITRKDIIDTGIALCAPNVATEFTGNFDFQERDELIDHILENEEVLCQNIHVHVLPDEVPSYTANNMADLIQMQRYFLQRWFSPLAANRRSMADRSRNSRIVTHRNNVYITTRDEKTSSKKLQKMNSVFLSANVVVGSGVAMDNVVVGEGCKIGDNVVLKNCTLGSGVTIAEKTCLTNCIIDDNVTFGLNCTIGQGCYIEKDYTVADNSIIHDNSIVSKDCLRLSSETSSESLDSGGISEAESDDFFDDILEAMKDAYERLDSSESTSKNLLLEINRSRLIYGLSIDEVAQQILPAFLSLRQCDNLKVVAQLIDEWLEIFENFYRSESGQSILLKSLQQYAESHTSFTKKLKHVVSYFYNSDVLDEDAIFKWFDVMERDTEMYKEINHLVAALKQQAQE